mmetsp:Transcript_46437/g.129197  ORF Transcript_46437/g.129197 Transcript_46437/m.129197 type:complete len:221 (-) Transcript_46437:602-1264(-)
MSCRAVTVLLIFSLRSLQSSMNIFNMNFTFLVPDLCCISLYCALAHCIRRSSSYEARSRMSRLTKVSSCNAEHLSSFACCSVSSSTCVGLSLYGEPCRTSVMWFHHSCALSMTCRIKSTPSKMPLSVSSLSTFSVFLAGASPSGPSKPPISSLAGSGSASSTKATMVLVPLPPPVPPLSLIWSFFTGDSLEFILIMGSGLITRGLSCSSANEPSLFSPQA